MKTEINTGFISLHRKIMQNWIWQDADNLKIWIYLLLEANHTGNKIVKGNNIIEVKRGQIFKSLQTIASELRLSKGKIRNVLKLLQKDAMITLELHTNCTQILICNYDSYQTPTHKIKTSLEQNKNEIETSSKQVENTNNNINNVDNDNNGNNEVIADGKKTSLFEQLKTLYFDFWEKYYKIKPVWNFAKNGAQLKNLIKYFDGKTDDEIVKIMTDLFANWSKLDKFWADKNDIGQISSNIHKLLEKIKEEPQQNRQPQQQQGAGIINGTREVRQETIDKINKKLENDRYKYSGKSGIETGTTSGISPENEPF